jgi:hypothetical protein
MPVSATPRTDAGRKRNADRMRNDPVNALYRNQRWPRFKLQLEANGNVFCQRIVDGLRCDYRPRPDRTGLYFHHLISPRQKPSLFVDPGNVVRVCHKHHPPHAGDVPENLYVPTLHTLPGQGIVIPSWYPQPGQPVPADCPIWNTETALGKHNTRFAGAALPHGGRSSAVGDDQLDDALGTQADIDALLEGV